MAHCERGVMKRNKKLRKVRTNARIWWFPKMLMEKPPIGIPQGWNDTADVASIFVLPIVLLKKCSCTVGLLTVIPLYCVHTTAVALNTKESSNTKKNLKINLFTFLLLSFFLYLLFLSLFGLFYIPGIQAGPRQSQINHGESGQSWEVRDRWWKWSF